MFMIIGMIINAQINGVTVYTASGGAGSNFQKQQIACSPAGEIYFVRYTPMELVKFSGGNFSSATMTVSGANAKLFATSTGVWYADLYGNVLYYNGNMFYDHTAAISAAVGGLDPTQAVLYIGSRGSDILFGTRKGIIKYNGVNFSLINKNNSNLISDTVNCIFDNGSLTYVGTDQGLCTYNGSAFSSPILFSGSSNKKVDQVFSNGVTTIATLKGNNSFNYYKLSGSTLTRMPAFEDSMAYVSGSLLNMFFRNNDPVFSGGMQTRVAASNTSYTTYVMPNPFGSNKFAFPHPANQNKMYVAASSGAISVAEVDLNAYTNFGPSFNNDEFKYLDTNNVKAQIGETSLKHWDMYGNGSAKYFVPKTQSVSANFASSLWIGGLDNSNQLHLAGETYRQTGIDFWPGPLDTVTAVANDITGAPFNRIWKFSCNQINQFVANYNASNFSANNSPSFADINSYIANGSNTSNFSMQLAPYKDWNNDGIYDPSQGEYPIIKGHQMIYSVFNDNYKPHTETGGLPLGVEIHERSYAYNVPNLPDTMQVINYSTFYNYEVINRSNNDYNNMYVSFWSDVDLGYYLNDYIGTDTVNKFAYVYNSGSEGNLGYGTKHPMLAIAAVKQLENESDGVDNNNNGVIDEAGEKFDLSRVTFYNNNVGAFPPATTNPNTKWQYYNYMSGRWKDSSYFVPTGSAYNPTVSIAPTNFVYTGNPQSSTGWTEATAGNLPGDRRIICTVGPFNFPAKKKITIEYAMVFSRDTTLNNVNNNLSLLQRDVRNTRYFLSQQNSGCTPVVNVGLKKVQTDKLNTWIYPNPASSELNINLDYNAVNADITVYDMIGRVVMKTSIAQSYNKKLDVSGLARGVYVVEISDKGMKSANRFIKN